MQTRRAFFHQLKEVISKSDVIMIVLDARDPMVWSTCSSDIKGCRSKLIEKKILEKDPNKRIILVINKIDLVPKNIALMVLRMSIYDDFSGWIYSDKSIQLFSLKHQPSLREVI